MSYRINRTDGSEIIKLNEGEIDQISTDITLIGDNYSNYGEYVNENFIKLLENFSSTSQPDYPIPGQVWYDREHERLKVYTESGFDDIRSTLVSASQPVNLQQGDIWIDDVENQLYFYDGAQLQLAGPIYKTSQGVSGFVVENVLDTTQRSRTIIKLMVGNVLIGIFSKDSEFTPLNPVVGFSGSIRAGFNSGTLSGLKFRVTSSDTLSLIDAAGQKRYVTDFMVTDGNTSTTGTVTLQNISPLVIGSAGSNVFLFNFNSFRILSTTLNQNYRLKVTNTNGLIEAITVDASNEHVGIFKTSPQATLHVGGNFSVAGNTIINGIINTSNIVNQPVSLATNIINLTQSTYFTKNITVDTTFSLAGLSSISSSYTFYLDITLDTSHAITWWAGVLWANGIAPSLSGNTKYIFKFTTTDQGFTWAGNKIGIYSLAPAYSQTLWAWGDNQYYQLGLGDYDFRNLPEQVNQATDWSLITAGNYHSLAIKADGTLWGWGYNYYGQLGMYEFPFFQQINPSANWESVTVGDRFIISVKSDGTLWSRGYNYYYELGLGDSDDRFSLTQVGTDSNWKLASSGKYHTLATKTDGTLWSWGYNSGDGELGHGDSNNRSVPTQVGVASDWNLVSAGSYFSLAIKSNGTLWAWGKNNYGQLGHGDTAGRSIPEQVGTATNWQQIDAGYNHSLAIKTDGTLWGWGYNSAGQAGTGITNPPVAYGVSPASILSPTQIGTETNWRLISAGSYHSAALKTDNTLWMWGTATYGALGNGDGSSTDNVSPIQLLGNNWSDVSLGYYFSVAVKTDGTLWGWGNNSDGQLGLDEDLEDKSVPTQIGTNTNWSKVSAGSTYFSAITQNKTLWSVPAGATVEDYYSLPTPVGSANNWKLVSAGGYNYYGYTIAIKTDGSLWAWGSNDYNQLGTGDSDNRSFPTRIGNDTDWKLVSTSDYHVLATKTDGTLWGWGYNGYMQLANPTTNYVAQPTQIGTSNNWDSVSAGGYYEYGLSFAIKTDGTLWAWGYNIPALGIDESSDNTTPTQVGTDSNWKLVASGYYHTLGIKTDNTLWGWGDSEYGQLGYQASLISKFYKPTTLTGWESVSAGKGHTLFLKDNGTLWGFGNNYYQQLGTLYQYGSVTQIDTTSTWSLISAGYYNSFAIKTDGTLWSWGYNGYGHLGDGTTSTRSSPMPVLGGGSWSKVSAGRTHTLGIKTDGSLWGWGYNFWGPLGDNTNIDKYSPVSVAGGGTWIDVAAGYDFSAAIKSDGTLWGWGQRSGNGTAPSRNSPVLIGGTNTWTKVVAGIGHGLALKNDGTLWGWGGNSFGELGDGTTSERLGLVPVVSGSTVVYSSQRYPFTTYSQITNQLLGSSGLSLIYDGNSDEGSYSIPIPWSVEYLGVSYATGSVYVFANSYITFGSANSVYTGFSRAFPAVPKIFIGAGDRSIQKLYGGVEGTSPNRTYRIRFQGHSLYYGGDPNNPTMVWEAIFYENTPNKIDIQLSSTSYGTFYSICSSDAVIFEFPTRSNVGYSIIANDPGFPSQTITFPTSWQDVASSSSVSSSIAIANDGSVWSWGENSRRQLGFLDTSARSVPTKVVLAENQTWDSLAIGESEAFGINSINEVWRFRAITSYAKTSSPIQILAGSEWKLTEAAAYNSFGIKTDGSLWVWGRNNWGELGIGDSETRYAPEQVGSLTNWELISSGRYTVLGLTRE